MRTTICRRSLRCTLDPLLRDQIDEQIVALLVENARASFQDIGAQVGLSAPAVKRRVDRLQESGVIVGFTAVVDPGAVGHGTEAFVELWCRSRTSPREIEAMFAGVPEVVAAYTVAGDADALLHLRTRDTRELESAVERIRASANAERTRTVIVLSRLQRAAD
jgi:DNA-binding Lrp family transcriptional regulator